MTTNRTSRRAEDFDRALAAEGGAHVDPTMAALVAVAGALAALPQRPAPAFREGLRAKLMAEAASMAAAPAASVPAATVPAQRVPRSLAKTLAKPAAQVATGGLAATIAATGLVVGTSRALPGDALYGLKRTVEGLQVGVAGGATGEAVALLKLAETRIDEVQDLLARGDLDGVRKALTTLADEVRSATSRLLAEARAGSRAAYDRLQAAIATLTEKLVALLGALPDDQRDAASLTLATLNVAAVQLGMMTRPPDPAQTGGPSVTPSNPLPTGTGGPTVHPTGTPTVPTGTPTVPTGTPTVPTGTPTVPTGTPTLPTGTPTIPLPTTTPTLPVTLPPVVP
jgi:hypothetical protein